MALLQPLVRADSPLTVVPKMPRIRRGDLSWVDPRLHCEVSYLERTHEGRLRAPVYRGLVETGPPPLDRPIATLKRGSRTLAMKNLDKVWWPELRTSPRATCSITTTRSRTSIVPHMQGRPFTMLRYPDGVAGKKFFQKDAPSHTPEWVHLAPLPAGGRTIRFPVLERRAVAALGDQHGLHRPERLVRAGRHARAPDGVIFDLDPAEGPGLRGGAPGRAAGARRARLGRPARFPRRAARRGLHVLVPIARRHDHAEARELVAAVGAALEHTASGARDDEVGEDRAQGRADRREPERLRPHHGVGVLGASGAGAPVSTPLDWDEVTPSSISPRSPWTS